MANWVYNKEDFVKKASKKYQNRYDYSLTIYKNSREKIKIICPGHGIFEQSPNSHLNGRGCPECGKKIYAKKNRLDSNIFFCRAKEIHGNRY